MAGYLTTHILDTARGRPAPGVPVALFRLEGDVRERVGAAVTNADGRTDAPILDKAAFRTGGYELQFDVGDYLSGEGSLSGEGGPSGDGGAVAPAFLDVVPIRFRMEEAAHYHVPLLLSPYGYSTYRGS